MINSIKMLKGIVIKSICLTFSFFILISMIMPFNIVHADDATYIPIPSDGCVYYGVYNNNNLAIGTYNSSPEVRTVMIWSQYSDDIWLYFVSLSNFTWRYRSDGSPCPINNAGSPASSRTYNGVTYYKAYRTFTKSRFNSTGVPYFKTQDYPSYSLEDLAYELTYGSLSNDPAPPFNHGALNVGFYTRFGITGTDPNNTTFKENVDVITWNNVDSNGNALNNLGISVNIRAVPITWKSNQESVLNTFGLSDAISDVNSAAYFNNINFNDNEYSLRWGDVIQAFKNVYPSWSYVKYFDDGFWYKNGWYYQIQYYDSGLLTDGEPYTSDWQTITTTTSVSVADAETVEHNYTYQIDYGLDPGLFNTIQNVNNDNSTTNNWYIDQLVINTEPTPEDSENWFSTLLQTIVDALKEIINGILGIGGKLLDEIFKLIEAVGVNVVDFFTRIWNDLLDLINNIDLTLFEWYPDDEATESYNFVQPIIDAFIDTGLIYMLMIPFVVLVVRVFL